MTPDQRKALEARAYVEELKLFMGEVPVVHSPCNGANCGFIPSVVAVADCVNAQPLPLPGASYSNTSSRTGEPSGYWRTGEPNTSTLEN